MQNPASRLLQIGQKLEKWQWRHNDVTICQHAVFVKVFWDFLVSLVKISYWSKFHVNIATGSGVKTVFFHKRLTGNPEISPSKFFAISGDWEELGMNVSDKLLLNAANFQGNCFYHFWVIRKKQRGGWIHHAGLELNFLTVVIS